MYPLAALRLLPATSMESLPPSCRSPDVTKRLPSWSKMTETRAIHAGLPCMQRFIDAQIGLILETLKETGHGTTQPSY